MASIDERVVNLKFNASNFQEGIKNSMTLLERFKKALNFSGTKSGVADLQSSINSVSLDSISEGTNNVSASFSAMGAVAFGVLANISSRAVDAGLSLTKSLTIQSAIDGFKEYETGINSVQTILANTQSKGSTLQDVNRTLDDLNTYADQTIYNFGEMTKNIGTFTAAGVDLDKSATSIKGIANLAAMSGSNSQQAAGAMYQLSQAIAANKVGLMDWNSVVNAGMGGQVFQEALFETGKAMNTLKDVPMGKTFEEWTKEGNSFRDSLQDGWITGEVLTNTLAAFTQDVDEAQLKSIGYSDEQIAKFRELAKTATEAATVSKTLSDVINTVQESVGSGWAQTWQILVGDFEEAKQLFTGLGNYLTGTAGRIADNRNKMLKSWKEMGGRKDVIDGLINSGKFLESILSSIGAAFRDVFPAVTAERLKQLSEGFKNFTTTLKLSGQNAENLKRVFRGVFSIFSIAGQIIGAVVKAFASLFGVAIKGSGGFLSLLASVGDLIYGFDQLLKKSGAHKAIFSGIAHAVAIPIKVIQALINWFSRLISTGDDSVSTFTKMGEALKAFFDKIGNMVSSAVDSLSPIKESLANLFSGIDFGKILTASGLAGVALLIRKLFKDGIPWLQGDIVDSIKEVFENIAGAAKNFGDVISSVTDALKTMQTDIRANIILKIAIALGILAASLKILSSMSLADIGKSLGAVAIGLGELMGAMVLMTKLAGLKGIATLPILSTSMILLATAALIMAQAVKSLSGLGWEELAKGLVGVAGSFAIMAGAVKLLPTKGMISTGLGLIVLSAGVIVLAQAVKQFAGISWEELGRGLVGMAGTLLIIAAAVKLLPTKGMVATGAGLILIGLGVTVISKAVENLGRLSLSEVATGLGTLAGALLIIYGAVKIMGKSLVNVGSKLLLFAGGIYVLSEALTKLGEMSLESVGKALLAMAGALAIIVIALKLMPTNIAGQGGGLLLMAASITILSSALSNLGSMSWEEIAKSLVALAGALAILAASLYLMTGTLAGSAALAIASVSLLALSFALRAMGEMSLADIGKALLVLAGALTVLGVAALVLTPVIPSLLGLGAGLLLIGAATLAAGAGIYLIVAGFKLFSDTILVAVENTIKFVEALPRLAEAFFTAVTDTLNVLAERIPSFASAATNMVIAFMQAIADNTPRVVDQGLQMVIQLMNGIADAIRSNGPALGAAAANIGTAIIQGLTGAIVAGAATVVHAIVDAAKSALSAAKSALGIRSPSREFKKVGRDIDRGLALGIKENSDDPITEAKNLALDVLDTFDMIKDVMLKGDFNGKGLFHEDEDFVDNLFHIRENLLGIVEPLDEVINGIGNFKGVVSGLDILSDFGLIANGERLSRVLGEINDSVSRRYSGLGLLDTIKTAVGDFHDIYDMVSTYISTGDYNGAGHELFEEDSEFVSLIGDIHRGFKSLPSTILEASGAVDAFGLSTTNINADEIRDTFDMMKTILETGDFNGRGIFHEDSPVLDNVFKLREILSDIYNEYGIQDLRFDTLAEDLSAVIPMAEKLFRTGDFEGDYIFHEDSPFVGAVLDARKAFLGFQEDVLGVRKEVDRFNDSFSETGHMMHDAVILGDFNGRGIFHEDSPFVTGLLNVNRTLVEVKDNFEGSRRSISDFITDLRLSSISSFTESVKDIADFSDDLTQGLKALENDFVKPTYSTGQKFITELTEGINSKRNEVVRTVTKISEETQKEFRNKIVDPAEKWGRETVEKIRKGAEEAYKKYIDPVVVAARKAQDEINRRLRAEYNKHIAPTVEIGRNMVEGMRKGIRDNMTGLSGAARGMSEGVLNTTRNTLGIRSPSKEFEKIGSYVDEGFANGIEDNTPKVQKSARKMIKDVMDTVSDGVEIANGIMDVFAKGVEVAAKLMELFTPKETEEAVTTTDKVAEKVEANTEKLEEQTPKLEKAAEAQEDVAEKIEDNTEKIEEAEEKQTASLNELGMAYLEFAKAGVEVGKGVVEFASALNDTIFNVWNSLDRMSRRMNDHGRTIGTAMTIGITKAMHNGSRDVSWATDEMALDVIDRAEGRFGLKGSAKGVFYEMGNKNAKGLVAGFKNWLNLSADASSATTRRVFKEVIGEYLTNAGKILDGTLKVISGLSAAANVADKLGIDWVSALNLQGLVSGFGSAQSILSTGMSQLTAMLGPGVAAAIPGIGIAIAAIAAWVHIVGVDRMLEIGRNLIGGLIDGVKTMFGAVTGVFHDILNIKNIFDINEWIQIGANLIGGLVEGIKKTVGSVWDALKNLAHSTVDGFKRLLGIKSPSRVFETFGVYLDEGLAKGIAKSAKRPTKEIFKVGNDVKSTLMNTLSNLEQDLEFDSTLRPTISPVLDLSNVRRDASGINGIFGSVSLGTTGEQASAISRAEQLAFMEALQTISKKEEEKSIVFNQYNTSPKSLSAIDIYRNTNSQLAVAERRIRGTSV